MLGREPRLANDTCPCSTNLLKFDEPGRIVMSLRQLVIVNDNCIAIDSLIGQPFGRCEKLWRSDRRIRNTKGVRSDSAAHVARPRSSSRCAHWTHRYAHWTDR